MHTIVAQIALAWATALLVACTPAIFRARDNLVRIIAADTFMFIMIVWFLVFALLDRSAHVLDAVLVLALLAFSASVAATRYHLEERIL